MRVAAGRFAPGHLGEVRRSQSHCEVRGGLLHRLGLSTPVTFVEQVPAGLTSRDARRTPLLRRQLETVGVALAVVRDVDPLIDVCSASAAEPSSAPRMPSDPPDQKQTAAYPSASNSAPFVWKKTGDPRLARPINRTNLKRTTWEYTRTTIGHSVHLRSTLKIGSQAVELPSFALGTNAPCESAPPACSMRLANSPWIKESANPRRRRESSIERNGPCECHDRLTIDDFEITPRSTWRHGQCLTESAMLSVQNCLWFSHRHLTSGLGWSTCCTIGDHHYYRSLREMVGGVQVVEKYPDFVEAPPRFTSRCKPIASCA